MSCPCEPPPLYVPPVCPPPADLPRHDLVPVKSDDDGDDDDDYDGIYNDNQDYEYGPDSIVRNPNASLASSESVIICRNQRMMTEDGLRPVDKVINCRRCSNRGLLRQRLLHRGENLNSRCDNVVVVVVEFLIMVVVLVWKA